MCKSGWALSVTVIGEGLLCHTGHHLPDSAVEVVDTEVTQKNLVKNPGLGRCKDIQHIESLGNEQALADWRQAVVVIIH